MFFVKYHMSYGINHSILLCCTIHLLTKQDDDDEYCDAVAKKCKAGDKKSCKIYKKKCAKVNYH